MATWRVCPYLSYKACKLTSALAYWAAGQAASALYAVAIFPTPLCPQEEGRVENLLLPLFFISPKLSVKECFPQSLSHTQRSLAVGNVMLAHSQPHPPLSPQAKWSHLKDALLPQASTASPSWDPGSRVSATPHSLSLLRDALPPYLQPFSVPKKGGGSQPILDL